MVFPASAASIAAIFFVMASCSNSAAVFTGTGAGAAALLPKALPKALGLGAEKPNADVEGGIPDEEEPRPPKEQAQGGNALELEEPKVLAKAEPVLPALPAKAPDDIELDADAGEPNALASSKRAGVENVETAAATGVAYVAAGTGLSVSHDAHCTAFSLFCTQQTSHSHPLNGTNAANGATSVSLANDASAALDADAALTDAGLTDEPDPKLGLEATAAKPKSNIGVAAALSSPLLLPRCSFRSFETAFSATCPASASVTRRSSSPASNRKSAWRHGTAAAAANLAAI
jgi:hypothetical protein